MSKASYTISVHIDQPYTTGTVQRNASQVFFAEDDDPGHTASQLIHCLEDRQPAEVTQIQITINQRLPTKRAVALVRKFNKLVEEVPRLAKKKTK